MAVTTELGSGRLFLATNVRDHCSFANAINISPFVFFRFFFFNEFLKRNIADEARKKIVCVFIKTVIVMARTKSFAVISLVNFWIYIYIDYFLYWWWHTWRCTCQSLSTPSHLIPHPKSLCWWRHTHNFQPVWELADICMTVRNTHKIPPYSVILTFLFSFICCGWLMN